MIGSRGGGGRERQGQAHAGDGGDGNAVSRWLAAPRTEAEVELRQALDRAVAREADEVALRRVWARIAEPEALAPASSFADPNRQDDQSAAMSMSGRATVRRRPRWAWIAAASLAGATAALAFMLIGTRSEVRFAVVRKATPVTPLLITGGNNHEAPDLRSALVAPATVRTGLGETIHLTLRGGTEVAVTSQSALVLDENDRPSVSAGEVRFHVPSQEPGRTFAVAIGSYRVVVVGTRFRVRVNQHNTVVGVDEGIVEIWSDHRVARIGAGESWSTPEVSEAQIDSTTMEPAVSPPPEPAVPVVEPAVIVTPHSTFAGKATRGIRLRSMRAKAASTGAATTAGKTMPKEAPRTLALANPYLGPVAPQVAASPPVAIAAPAVSPAKAPTPTAALAAPAASGDAPVTATPAASPGVGPPPVATPDPVAPLVVQAREARIVGDFRRALELYRSLAQRHGAAGENAEYEIGRVLRDGLRQPREAISAWRQYRAHHPRGVLRVEADISVIETLVSVGDKAGALAEASEFIDRHPESERRLEVARISGDLLRERGDCAGAISAYDVAMGSNRFRKDSGRDIADSVSFHRSTCVLRSNHGEGVAALKAYLHSYPWGHYRGEAQRLLTAAPSQTPATGP